jgi:hypothetical protein
VLTGACFTYAHGGDFTSSVALAVGGVMISIYDVQ